MQKAKQCLTSESEMLKTEGFEIKREGSGYGHEGVGRFEEVMKGNLQTFVINK